MPDAIDVRINNLWPIYNEKLLAIDSLDTLILRAHALLELTLQDLLAARLCADPQKLPDLPFSKLAPLALAGMDPDLAQVVMTFNKIRNYVAHHLDAADLEMRVGELFSVTHKFQYPWPPEPSSDKVSVLKEYLRALSLAFATLPISMVEFRWERDQASEGRTELVSEQQIVERAASFVPAFYRFLSGNGEAGRKTLQRDMPERPTPGLKRTSDGAA